MLTSYSKVLTKNDVGETGGHQGGIAVPKSNRELMQFFPQLNADEFNPDTTLICIDPDGIEWEMRFVYYNGKTFKPPKSTRNEYRVTHMTKYFSRWKAKAGDEVVFTKTNKKHCFKISIKQNSNDQKEDESDNTGMNKPIVLRGWSRVF